MTKSFIVLAFISAGLFAAAMISILAQIVVLLLGILFAIAAVAVLAGKLDIGFWKTEEETDEDTQGFE